MAQETSGPGEISEAGLLDRLGGIDYGRLINLTAIHTAIEEARHKKDCDPETILRIGPGQP